MSRISFPDFCEKVIGLHLTPGQSVIAKLAFGDHQMADLDGEERALATEMLGGEFHIPDLARHVVALRLGRGSGKTTLCAAYLIYSMMTQDLSRCGPGDLPIAVLIAPNKQTARIGMRMMREYVRSHKELERRVESDRSENENDPVLVMKRPDGRMVAAGVFAAAVGGKNVRGRSIVTALMDEAEFFRSEDDSAVSDTDVYRAITPRLLGKALFISTPWPTETLMSQLFAQNWSNPVAALAIKAPTTLMRSDSPEALRTVEIEMKRDPDNARREFYCETDGIRTEGFFENIALEQACKPLGFLGEPRNPLHPVAVGVDWAFSRDSSTCCVVQFDGTTYRVSDMLELKPKPGAPLKPSEVVARFAEIAHKYGVSHVVGDEHYREALKEHLQSHGLGIISVPGGITGKALTYSRTRSLLHDGKLLLPPSDLTKRLIQQAGLVVARATAGGNLTIRQARRTGLGHGDLVSAWVAAVHHLAYHQPKKEDSIPERGTPEWETYQKAQLIKANADAEEGFKKRLKRQVIGQRRGLGW